MSFVFYDTETTGTNTSFDQILQFGAIKTDYDLKELERFEIRCRLLPYVVPSPGAMHVTGVTVEQLTDPTLPSHYRMVRAIREKLSAWSPAIFIGHNSIGFDEHLFRQALFKTLHNPYLTNMNGNCRSDSLRMIQAVARFCPDAISIPLGEDGKPVFKLDRLAPANGFDHRDAHDAMADVEATLHLCRLMAERCPEYWSNFLRFAQKAAVNDFCLDEELFLLTDFYFSKPYSWVVTRIGQNPDNSSEAFVFNLEIDPEELADLSEADLIERLSVSPKPVRGLRTNACPIVLPYEEIPDHLRVQQLNESELRRRAARIRGDSALVERVIAVLLASRGEKEPSIHVEQQIYDGFIANDDQAVMDRFHETDWAERVPLVNALMDSRLRTLGNRLIFVEAPHAVADTIRHEYEVALARRLMNGDGTVPWLTLPKAIQETEDMLAISEPGAVALLKDLRAFLLQRSGWASALIV